MNKRMWIIIAILVIAAAVFAYTGVGIAKNKGMAATPTPAPTAAPTAPVKPTPVVTPTAEPAMTAEDFLKKLYEPGGPDRYGRGTSVVVSGTVTSKDDHSFEFSVSTHEAVRGAGKFSIIVYLAEKNDLSQISVGKTLTVKGKVGDVYFGLNGWISIKEAKRLN